MTRLEEIFFETMRLKAEGLVRHKRFRQLIEEEMPKANTAERMDEISAELDDINERLEEMTKEAEQLCSEVMLIKACEGKDDE